MSYLLNVGQTADINPNTGVDADFTYVSQNPDRATVNSSGVVTGIAAGLASIKWTRNSDNATGTITFLVKSSTAVATPFGVTLTATQVNLVPAMTGYTTPSGVASASSEYPYYLAWQAFDHVDAAALYAQTSNDTSTTWASSGASLPQWLAYQFAAPVTANGYAINQRAYQAYFALEQAPKAWTFEGSNDGITWLVLDTQTNQTGWTVGERRAFNITPVTYSRYRLNVSAVVNGSTHDCQSCSGGSIPLWTA
jgi:hypothetical protein